MVGFCSGINANYFFIFLGIFLLVHGTLDWVSSMSWSPFYDESTEIIVNDVDLTKITTLKDADGSQICERWKATNMYELKKGIGLKSETW